MGTDGIFEVQFTLAPVVRTRRQASPKPEAAPAREDEAPKPAIPRLTRVLALAVQFQAMLDRGVAKDFADLARLGCVCRERISQIMVLNYLAPDIQADILSIEPVPGGRFPLSETQARRVAKELVWSDQRRKWRELLVTNRVQREETGTQTSHPIEPDAA
jgi:hypothetical protein